MMDLAPRDRPREKLERCGPGALGDNELLAVLLGHGTAGNTALDVANRVLAAAGSLQLLTRLGADELAGIAGVGPVMAARVQAAIELGRRTLLQLPAARPRIGTAQDAAQYLLPQFGAHAVERFGVLLLDTRHRLMRTRLLSIGSIDSSLAHPREVFREAVQAGAASIVAFHNHPSGDPTPSDEDLIVTRRLIRAGEVVGIDVDDHLVLADMHYCSIRMSGRL
jgi:DNA repair protein RadC